MDRYIDIEVLKKEWGLAFDKAIQSIATIIGEEYKEYSKNPTNYEKKETQFQLLMDSCKEIKHNIIPYATITGVIFSNNVDSKIAENDQLTETSFADILQGKFEKFLIAEYGKQQDNDEETMPFDTNQEVCHSRISEDKQPILVIYKLIEHIRLAISQKEGLYEEQSIEINQLNDEIKIATQTFEKQSKKIKKLNREIENTKETYDSIVSNYISILGIFAAILMAAFGGIQGFTSVFSKNGFSLEDSILLSCMGFIGIIIMLFVLLNAVAKLTGKSIARSNETIWYHRHPMLAYSLLALTTIMLIVISYKVSISPPTINCIGIVYGIPLSYLIIMLIILNYKRNS